MIENATRAAWEAVFQARETLARITHAADAWTDQMQPTDAAYQDALNLSGSAWAAGADSLDLMKARTTPGEIGAWLARVDQIEAEARTILP
jgi:hypothetical protein